MSADINDPLNADLRHYLDHHHAPSHYEHRCVIPCMPKMFVDCGRGLHGLPLPVSRGYRLLQCDRLIKVKRNHTRYGASNLFLIVECRLRTNHGSTVRRSYDLKPNLSSHRPRSPRWVHMHEATCAL